MPFATVARVTRGPLWPFALNGRAATVLPASSGSGLAPAGSREGELMNLVIVVAGLAYGASRLGVSQVWIIAGALVIIGLGLMAGIVKTRQKDPAS